MQKSVLENVLPAINNENVPVTAFNRVRTIVSGIHVLWNKGSKKSLSNRASQCNIKATSPTTSSGSVSPSSNIGATILGKDETAIVSDANNQEDLYVKQKQVQAVTQNSSPFSLSTLEDSHSSSTSYARRKESFNLPAPIMITPPITPRNINQDLPAGDQTCAKSDIFAESAVNDIGKHSATTPDSLEMPVLTSCNEDSPIEDFNHQAILVAVDELDTLVCPESPESPNTPSLPNNNTAELLVTSKKKYFRRSFLSVSLEANTSDTSPLPSPVETTASIRNSLDPDTPNVKPTATEELLSRTDQFGFIHATSTNVHEMKSPTGKDISRSQKWKSMAKFIKIDMLCNTDSRNSKYISKWARYEFPITNEKFIRRCFKGIPHEWRSHAWFYIITTSSGLYHDLDNTQQLHLEAQWLNEYHIFQTNEMYNTYDYTIHLDIPRTFPTHISFMNNNQKGQACLFRLMKGLSNKYPEIGYVQGMCLVGATLLLVMSEEKAYISLIHLFSLDTPTKKNPYRFHSIYSPGFPLLIETDHLINHLMGIYCSRIRDRFRSLGIDTKIFTTKWIVTLFVGCCQLNQTRPDNISDGDAEKFSDHIGLLPFSVVLRIWDLIFLYGYDIVPVVSISILKWYEVAILSLDPEDYEAPLAILLTNSHNYHPSQSFTSAKQRFTAKPPADPNEKSNYLSFFQPPESPMRIVSANNHMTTNTDADVFMKLVRKCWNGGRSHTEFNHDVNVSNTSANTQLQQTHPLIINGRRLVKRYRSWWRLAPPPEMIDNM